MNRRTFDAINEYFDGKWEFGVHSIINNKSSVRAFEPNVKYLNVIKAKNANGCGIYIRPLEAIENCYLLIDDLSIEAMFNHKNCNGRLIIESSPNNFQIWIRSSRELSLIEKKYWLIEFGSDPGATPLKRWGRAPGFTNRKPERLNNKGLFPYSNFISISNEPVDFPKIDIDSHIEEINEVEHNCINISSTDITRSHFETGDDSRTDIRYSMSLIKRGFSKEEIFNRLLIERPNWDNHSGTYRTNDYLNRTYEKAVQYLK